MKKITVTKDGWVYNSILEKILTKDEVIFFKYERRPRPTIDRMTSAVDIQTLKAFLNEKGITYSLQTRKPRRTIKIRFIEGVDSYPNYIEHKEVNRIIPKDLKEEFRNWIFGATCIEEGLYLIDISLFFEKYGVPYKLELT